MAFGFTLGLPAADIVFVGHERVGHTATRQSRVHAIDKHVWTCAAWVSMQLRKCWPQIFVWTVTVVCKCGLLWPEQQPWWSRICVSTLHHCCCFAIHVSVALPSFPFLCNQSAMAWTHEMICGSSPEMESLNLQQMNSAKTCWGQMLLGAIEQLSCSFSYFSSPLGLVFPLFSGFNLKKNLIFFKFCFFPPNVCKCVSSLNATGTSNYGCLKHKYLFRYINILNFMVYCIYLSVIILIIVSGLHGWLFDFLLVGAAGYAADDIWG